MFDLPLLLYIWLNLMFVLEQYPETKKNSDHNHNKVSFKKALGLTFKRKVDYGERQKCDTAKAKVQRRNT